MQLLVKHDFASGDIAFLLHCGDHAPMPPVKRKARLRATPYFRQWREFRSLKQYEAAERVEVEPSTLSRLENGESPYNQDVLERLATAYGCEPADLLSVDPTRPRETEVVKLFRAASPEVQRIVETILKTGTGG